MTSIRQFVIASLFLFFWLVVLMALVGCGDFRNTVLDIPVVITTNTPTPKPQIIVIERTEVIINQKGEKGDQGEMGVSCQIVATSDGAAITCGNNTVGINNGKDSTIAGPRGLSGENGRDGKDLSESPYDIIEIIDPCGDNPSQKYEEIILKLRNGTYISSFSDNTSGKNTRFTTLSPGEYMTTDGTNCKFTIGGENDDAEAKR